MTIQKCPNCNSNSVAEILYGYITNINEIKEELIQRKITLGGCCITGSDPRWECNDCSFRWGEKK